MDLFEIIGYSLVGVAVMELLLGFIILTQNPGKSPVHKAVAAFSFFCSGYALFPALTYLRASKGLDFELFARATWIGWLSIPAALQFILYLKDEQSRAARLVGWILYPFWAGVFLLCLFTNVVEPGVYSLIPYVSDDGLLENPLRVFGAVLILWVIIESYRLKKQVKGIKKTQLDYFLTGIIIFGGSSALIAGFLQLVHSVDVDPSYGAYFSFPWVVLTFYAIIRYSLFDIRLVISRSLSIVLLVLIFSGLQSVLFLLFQSAVGSSLAILLSLSIAGVIFFGTPFRNRLQAQVRKVVVKGRYDYQHVLKESIKAIVTILDLDELLNYIIDIMKTSLGAENICLLLKEEDGTYRVRHVFGIPEETVRSCPPDNSLLQWIERTGRIVIRQDVEDQPPHEGGGKLFAYMQRTGAELVVPLLYKGQLRGILTLGRKGSKNRYVQGDIDLLDALADHVAVALENARLYEDARRVKGSLHESELRFLTLAQTTTAAIFIHQGGKFLYANPAGEAMAGYTREEFMAMDFWHIVHPAYVDMVRERAQARLSGEKVIPEYEFKVIKKNGEERWVNMTAGTIEYEGRPAVIGTLFDITARKQAEEERMKFYQESTRQYQERIEEEKRHVMEKEKILMDLHDGIGGITTNISILAEIARKTAMNEAVKKPLSTITRLAREGISEIRSFMHSLDTKDTDWHTLIAELRNQGMNMVEPHSISFQMKTAKKNMKSKPGSLLWVNTFRIYKEALTNVIKHSKATAVTVMLEIDEEKLSLAIYDDGIGLDGGRSGGRGLSTMKARAEEMGGSVTITSDGGTRVSLEIPLPLKYPLQGME